MNNAPHIFKFIHPEINKDLIGSRFSNGTLCLFYEDFESEYEISIENVFMIASTGKYVELSDFKQIS